MCPQTGLEVWERNWGKDFLQDGSGEPVAEGRVILIRPEFSPYISTIWFFLCNFERAVSTSHSITSIAAEGAASFCPGKNEAAGEQENWGFLWSDLEQWGLVSPRLVLNMVWWYASPFALLLVDLSARSWRQCYLNVYLNVMYCCIMYHRTIISEIVWPAD